MIKEEYGLHVWPCSIALAEYVWQQRHRFRNAHVLEVRKNLSRHKHNHHQSVYVSIKLKTTAGNDKKTKGKEAIQIESERRLQNKKRGKR